MPNIGIWEIMLLLLVLLLVFGPKRLPSMGRSLGRGMREFKESVTDQTRELKEATQVVPDEFKEGFNPLEMEEPSEDEAEEDEEKESKPVKPAQTRARQPAPSEGSAAPEEPMTTGAETRTESAPAEPEPDTEQVSG